MSGQASPPLKIISQKETSLSKVLHNIKENTWARIKPSKIHGVGVFAVRKISSGTNLFPETKVNFEFITWNQLGHVSPSIRKMIHDFFVDNDFGFWCPDQSLNQLNLSFYLNHSTTPNCYHSEAGEIFAVKDISIGQELTLNYSDFDEDDEPPKMVVG